MTLHAHSDGVGVRVQPFTAGKAHHVLGYLFKRRGSIVQVTGTAAEIIHPRGEE